jgi:hypothetical protein
MTGNIHSVRLTTYIGKLDSVRLTGVLRGAVVFSCSHGAGCRGLSKSYSSKTVSATRTSVRSAPLDLSRSISPRTASRSLNCGEDKSTVFEYSIPALRKCTAWKAVSLQSLYKTRSFRNLESRAYERKLLLLCATDHSKSKRNVAQNNRHHAKSPSLCKAQRLIIQIPTVLWIARANLFLDSFRSSTNFYL